MRTTTNIHGVRAIRVRPTVFETFVSHEITFVLKDGGEVTVSGFAAELLTIEVQEAQPAESEAEAA